MSFRNLKGIMNDPTDSAKLGSMSVVCGTGAQVVIRTALQDANVSPSVMGGLEMHGTGTSLGDPIEIGAASEVFAAPGDAASLFASQRLLVHPAVGYFFPLNNARTVCLVCLAVTGVLHARTATRSSVEQRGHGWFLQRRRTNRC